MENQALKDKIFMQLASYDEDFQDEVIGMLEEHPECLRIERSEKYSLLHIAAECGKFKVIQYLVGKGLAIDDPLSTGLTETPIRLAARASLWGHTEDKEGLKLDIVKWFLDHGANPNGIDEEMDDMTPLSEAVMKKNIQLVKLFLAYGADVNGAFQHRMYKNNLAIARMGHNEEMVDYLLAHGAEEYEPTPPREPTKDEIQYDILYSLGINAGYIF